MLVCPKCKTSNHATANFCESCGNDLTRLREADDALEEILLKESRKGAWALGIVAAIQAIIPVLQGFNDPVFWVIAGVFAVLAVWSLRAPLVASAVGLSVFVLLHLAEAFIDPSTIYRGILMKVIVISVLIGAIKGGLKHREFRRERGLA